MPRPLNIPQKKRPLANLSNVCFSNLSNLFAQAVNFHQKGQIAQAKRVYEQLLIQMPNHVGALHYLGVTEAQSGSYGRAVALMDKAILIKADDADIYSNRGNALEKLKRFDDALASYDKAISLKPDHADAHGNRANLLKKLKRLEDALTNYNKAILLKPHYADAYSNQGEVLQELGRFADALASYDKAISLKPDYAQAHLNRGNALKDLKRLNDALASYDKAISLKPDYSEGHYNRGMVLQEMKYLNDALASYDKAISLKPEYLDANWNKSLCLLLAGNFLAGWKLYEYRWQTESLVNSAIKTQKPLWLGWPNIQGMNILLHSEQGLGDTIQFCRYAALVKQLGARVTLKVQAPLVNLLKQLKAADEVIADFPAETSYDYHCPLMSLPLAFKTELSSIPDTTPYLYAEPAKSASWKQTLGQASRLRVGLVWSGSPTHKHDTSRSIELRDFLAQLPVEHDYISLQKELRDTDKAALTGSSVQWLGESLSDFTDTAALCVNLDVLVSVDTSVAHLAGALGKKTFLLLPFSPDYRWLLDRDDTPWYPSLTLFRQDSSRQWAPVLKRVGEEIRKLSLTLPKTSPS
ncbi:MAG: tetratricopeptide repeat-containing glycosyltransferase family protein [Burkholderiales bacterium]|jgi:tetratricopeptide (TPR) repeat protein|nr:tetratricopeptide repeat-containing glycosyltransferase family protein [Burkholderiales bacterium]